MELKHFPVLIVLTQVILSRFQSLMSGSADPDTRSKHIVIFLSFLIFSPVGENIKQERKITICSTSTTDNEVCKRCHCLYRCSMLQWCIFRETFSRFYLRNMEIHVCTSTNQLLVTTRHTNAKYRRGMHSHSFTLLIIERIPYAHGAILTCTDNILLCDCNSSDCSFMSW